MEKIALFQNKKEWLLFAIFITLIFGISIFFEWQKFQILTAKKYHETNATVINQYIKFDKRDRAYNVLRLTSNNYHTFYTTTYEDLIDIKNRSISLVLITDKITFIDFIKGFYAPSFKISLLPKSNPSIYERSLDLIGSQHQHSETKELFSALFLASGQSKDLRDKIAKYASAHLIALSGFHLGILTIFIAFIIGYPYKILQRKFFPYRNSFIDLTIVSTIVLGIYLIFVGVVPSLLRAYTMLLFGIFLLYRHIDLFNFTNLFIVTLVLVAIFPKLLFNVGFLLSIAGVFYIFLFIRYYTNKNIFIKIFILGYYIFFAMLPIVHFYFPITAFTQLLSPIITAIFAPFFILSIIFHLINFGAIFDNILIWGLNLPVATWEVSTPLWLLVCYLALSLLAIFHRYFHHTLLAFLSLWVAWQYGYKAIISL